MSYATVSELCRRIGSSIFEKIYRVEGQTDFSADPAALEDLESAGAEIDGAIACRSTVRRVLRCSKTGISRLPRSGRLHVRRAEHTPKK